MHIYFANFLANMYLFACLTFAIAHTKAAKRQYLQEVKSRKVKMYNCFRQQKNQPRSRFAFS